MIPLQDFERGERVEGGKRCRNNMQNKEEEEGKLKYERKIKTDEPTSHKKEEEKRGKKKDQYI